MKILFSGGGTGGHFYPIIAIAQGINQIVEREKLVGVNIYFMSDSPYDERLLFENGITFKKASAGKLRKYFSLRNYFVDPFKTLWGIITATWKLFWIYPDVVFGKGGYASFPALWAARILRIPVFIHESDSIPGRVNLIAGKWGITKRVACSYPEAMTYFPEGKTALTGNPIRKELLEPTTKGSHEYFGLEKGVPIIFIVGGSQGAQNINDVIVDSLPLLVEKYQIVHHTGKDNFRDVAGRAAFLLEKSEHKDRYKPYAFLDETALKMIAGAASLVISRAGSTIFEIAAWGLPSIIIPIPEEISRDQRKNAFSYARVSDAIVLEERNLSSSILTSEIDRVLNDPQLQETMKVGAAKFAKKDAAIKIAEELIKLGLEHEK
ncbi:MAG TPA: UDP-N-acetylglucosamine--N-acetylmuramyl-(pentapeptide) pyrophosphoryl-undecaprenol N-acetylglucosamine transferase [Candidatus Paceibacterota bacterium]|nr:UDP-N-acetylglucosamine--N-acetylmuramyl-(pentapeptide) pyrophosphoryl-undecaprenol N-acetylglucosamine transferase [Candidatus Paceibacterota bacterium]